MALGEYQRRRRFEETPEPRGQVAPHLEPAAHTFVVQKHHARRAHYDFRIELDGVLKSWAVPKGPTLDPSQKRLAVMVEDHPIEYEDFEGVIPPGNYGAGVVVVWDRGTYHTAGAASAEEEEMQLRAGLAAGHLSLVLEGERLRGEFALVRLESAEDENLWLLIKAQDEFAGRAPADEDRSVLSGRTLEEVREQAAAEGRYWAETSAVDLAKLGLSRGPFPRGVAPMLPAMVEEPFDRQGWLFEVKWDGYRAMAEIERGEVRVYSRRGLPLDARFPAIARALHAITHDLVMDGEIVALDEEGVSRFQLLHNFDPGHAERLVYYVFDLLYLDGYDLRSRPLRERKEILQQTVPSLPNVRYSDHVWERGRALFDVAEQHGVEGIVAKDGGSPYVSGRTPFWRKIKHAQQQEAIICGYTAPRGSRTGFGALVLGVYEKGELVYVGHTGTGFDERMLSAVLRRLEPLITPRSPFPHAPTPNAPVTWVRPELVCQVRFSEWTRDGMMRHPVFLGVREDKRPEEVHRES